MLRDKLNGMTEVSHLKDEKAGELFLGFRIGAVGGRDSAVFPVQARRRSLYSKHSSNTACCSSSVIPSNFPVSMYPKPLLSKFAG